VFGVEAYMVSPAEARAKHPLIDLKGVTGGLFIPANGQADPAMLRRRWPKQLASAACASLRTPR
jgi:glycine/D-amino acid oxidase-like deaminating enzyme